VATFWPTLFWQEPGKTGFIEACLRLIEGRARNSKDRCSVKNRHSFGGVAPQHLVANLQKIPGIEERVLFEQGICDGIRVRVERARLPEFQRLLVGSVALGHQSLPSIVCKYNYAYSRACQGKYARPRGVSLNTLHISGKRSQYGQQSRIIGHSLRSPKKHWAYFI